MSQDKNGTEAQKTAVLVEVLGQNYGGLAKRMAETPEGRIIQFNKALKGIKATIGTAIYPAITSLLGYVIGKIPAAQVVVSKAIDSEKKALI